MLTLSDCSLEPNFVNVFIQFFLFVVHLLKSVVTFCSFTVFENKSLSQKEKSVAEFTNLASGALSTTIDFTLGKESCFLLVEAVIANCMATELAEIHVFLLLKSDELAGVAVRTFYLQLGWSRHGENRFSKSEIEGLLANSKLLKPHLNNLFFFL